MTTHYRFGDFKLLPAERLLFRRGSEVALTARAFALLVVLVERAGQLLSRDELMQRVWVGVVVEDNNLAVQVAALRKVLGADAIITIAGCGYRFALEVVELGGDQGGPLQGRGNLPARLPTMIGRETELAELRGLLAQDSLITLCGAPGVGKTRVAQALAAQAHTQFADGAWWIDLAALPVGASVAPAVARTLGIQVAPNADALATLTARLATASTLIVLDNAEHLAYDTARVAAALASETRHTSVIVTSQVPLHVSGERLVRLAPLGLAAAVQLLAERAVGAGASWNAADSARAENLCRALDGNALAIELAAARVDALGIDGLTERLNQRLTLLTPGMHATRRNALALALDWSHELMSERERVVLRRLAVFPGSFSLETAALMLADDMLPAPRVVETVLALVDRSLVSVERAPLRRYRLLETMRLYALDKLTAAGEVSATRRRLAAGLRWRFDEAYEESWHAPSADWRVRQEAELDTLWLTLDWAIEHEVETAVALFGSSWPIWEISRHAHARPYAETLARRLDEDLASRPVSARFWLAVARCLSVDQPALARDAARRAADHYRTLGDARGEYLALVEYAFNWRVDRPEARAVLIHAKTLEDSAWPAAVLERGWSTEATLQTSAGRHDDARATFTAVLELCQRNGLRPGVLRAQLNLADLERAARRIDEAVSLGESVLAGYRDAPPSSNMAIAYTNQIGALVEAGQMPRARALALECRRRLGALMLDVCIWPSLDTLALLHLDAGRIDDAARLAGASEREYSMHGQAERQPNEARDRERLIGALRRELGEERFDLLYAQGTRMDSALSTALAFEFETAAADAVDIQDEIPDRRL